MNPNIFFQINNCWDLIFIFLLILHMKKISKNYIYLFIIFIVSFLLSGRIEYSKPEYSKMDLHYYIQMAEASPGISENIPHFFAYRIFPQWLAGLMPGSVEFGFLFLNVISLFLLTYVFYQLMIEIKLNNNAALLAAVFFIFNRYFFQLQAWNYFQLTDVLSNTIIFASIILIRHQKFIAISILFILGVMTKETTLVILPIFLLNLSKKKISINKKLIFVSTLLPALILFVLLRIFIPTIGEENLIYQTFEESWKYLSLNVWLKTWIIPFVPFSAIPIIFFKEFYSFCKTHNDLLLLFLLVGFTSMLGFDYERLAAPASPLIFGFAAFIFEKYYSIKIIQFKEVIIILIIIIAASLYHLWGIVRLPNSTYSFLISVLTLLIASALFVKIKLKSNSSSKTLT